MDKKHLSKPLIGRLPQYLQFLLSIKHNSHSYISATTISKEMGLGEIMVRKDLHSVSGRGRPRVGYRVVTLIKDIEEVLDFNNRIPTIIVGAGHLGMALFKYNGFAYYGIEIVAAFDIDISKVQTFNKYKIYPFSELKTYIKEHNIRLAILTVPMNNAQFACNQLVSSGIKAIWNFSPKKLIVPKNVVVKHEDLALSLAYLKNKLKNKQ